MLSKLMPRNDRFDSLFAQQSQVAQAAAQVLVEMLTAGGDYSASVTRLRELEHQGDRLSEDVTKTLADSFIVPFDRQDIFDLANALDDLTDGIEEAGRKLWLYKMPSHPVLTQLAQIVLQQCSSLHQIMPQLEDKKAVPQLLGQVQTVRQLEDQADEVSDKASAELYDGVTETQQLIQAMRAGEIIQMLEDATDQAQRVGKVIESILLKNA